MYHDFNYETALASSLRAQWQLDDVLRADQELDFSRSFMPESLARTAVVESLNPFEQRILNQIAAHQYLSMFGIVEEFVLPFVLDHARTELNGDDWRVRALLKRIERFHHGRSRQALGHEVAREVQLLVGAKHVVQLPLGAERRGQRRFVIEVVVHGICPFCRSAGDGQQNQSREKRGNTRERENHEDRSTFANGLFIDGHYPNPSFTEHEVSLRWNLLFPTVKLIAQTWWTPSRD